MSKKSYCFTGAAKENARFEVRTPTNKRTLVVVGSIEFYIRGKFNSKMLNMKMRPAEEFGIETLDVKSRMSNDRI